MSHTRPFARSALLALSQRKQAHLNLPTLPIIQAWDRDYYCPPEPPAPPIPLPPLTPGTVFMALSRLFRHLYGVTLRPAEVLSGEVWHPDIRKLEVVDEDAGLIGWIYADLFARRGKASGAAHYTVRCSRRTDDDDEAGDFDDGHELNERMRQSLEFERAHREQIRGQEGVFQLPVVVLLCEFTRPTVARGASVLEWHEVQTLFHEMGHAMHCAYPLPRSKSQCDSHSSSYSNVGAHRVSQRFGNPMRHGLCRAPFHTDGTFPEFVICLVALRCQRRIG